MENWSCLVKNYLKLAFYVTLTLCAEAFAQTASTPIDEHIHASTNDSPVAYVYVSSTIPGSKVNEIRAYAAAPNGKLTSIPGSPFQENASTMAVNGKYLFAVDGYGANINSYRIESDGALRYATTTGTESPDNCNSLGQLFLDHTGASLYGLGYAGVGCANNTYESFPVDRATGGLDIVGNNNANDWLSLPATFIGNNEYAYTASCIADMYWGIWGYKRTENGELNAITVTVEHPQAAEGNFYCPSQAAADPTNHVAISMQPVNGSTFNPAGPAQLATYTAGDEGNLTTASTLSNMPETLVGAVKDLNMSPSGKLLAVGGTSGLQIFHFNGSEPIKTYTGLITKDEIDQFFWDNENHLYAISRTAGKLFVFTITPTSYSEAPGSPYTIEKPQNIIVQPTK
jgi:hypothetical protein